MFCARCGTKQEEGEKFCPNCGSQFEVLINTPQNVVEDDASTPCLEMSTKGLCEGEELSEFEMANLLLNNIVSLECSSDISIANPKIVYINTDVQSGVVSDMYQIRTELLFDSTIQKSASRKLFEKLQMEQFKNVSLNESSFKFYYKEEDREKVSEKIGKYRYGDIKAYRYGYDSVKYGERIKFPTTLFINNKYVKSVLVVEGKFIWKYKPQEKEGLLKILFMSEETKQLRERESNLHKSFLELMDFIELHKI